MATPEPKKITAEELLAEFAAIRANQITLGEDLQVVHDMLADIGKAFQMLPNIIRGIMGERLGEPEDYLPRDNNGEPVYPVSEKNSNEQIIKASQLIVTTDDNGNPRYKVKGGPFTKFGVTLWPEIIPLLGLDAKELALGPNPIDMEVRVLMVQITDKETGEVKTVPQKVLGRYPS